MHQNSGFSLIELAIVMVVIGLVLAAGAPQLSRYSDHLALNGAVSQIATVVRATRERALSSRTSRTLQFQAGYSGTDYRVEVGGVIQTGWKLPRRISYAWISGTISSVTLTPDGRCSTSGLVILQDPRGFRDTVSVLSSGLVLTK